MDPRALDTDQRAQVETGPSGICGGGDQRKQKCHKLPTAPSPEDEWQLTQSFTVHTQAVAFGVPDGLKGYSFALAAAPSLEQTHTHKHTHRLGYTFRMFGSSVCNQRNKLTVPGSGSGTWSFLRGSKLLHQKTFKTGINRVGHSEFWIKPPGTRTL